MFASTVWLDDEGGRNFCFLPFVARPRTLSSSLRTNDLEPSSEFSAATLRCSRRYCVFGDAGPGRPQKPEDAAPLFTPGMVRPVRGNEFAVVASEFPGAVAQSLRLR